MKYEVVNAYYFRYLNKIGGIESHLRYLGKKYGKDYDLVVFYKNADPDQLNELRKHITCIQIDDKDFVKCEVLFCCFNREILSQCEAKKVYLVLHGDYGAMVKSGQLNEINLPIDDRIDKYLGVSNTVCKSWEKLTGIKAYNVYEPIEVKYERSLMFVSATRLTPEKGWERMLKLAETLDEYNVNYTWFIYTNSPKTPTKNMVFLPPRLDITSKMSGYDAYIQLSDNEGFCLSIVEALLNKVPVIATDLPVLKEIGVNKDNSVILPFDMEKIPIDEIKNIYKKKFDYKAPTDKFYKYMIKTPQNRKTVKVKATNAWKKRRLADNQLGRIPDNGEEWEITLDRYYFLKKFEEKNKVRLIDESN